MQDWLAALEQLTVIQAVKTSFFTYPLINAAHIMAIGALITSVVLMDLRLLGWLTSLPETAGVRLFRRIAFSAFAVAAMTGAILFAVRAPDYAASRLFWLKLGAHRCSRRERCHVPVDAKTRTAPIRHGSDQPVAVDASSGPAC